MSDFIEFFEEKVNKALEENAGYVKCLKDYKKCQDFVANFKREYPTLTKQLKDDLKVADIASQSYQQEYYEFSDDNLDAQKDRMEHSLDNYTRERETEKYEWMKKYYGEMGSFVLGTSREPLGVLAQLEEITTKNMQTIEKHVCRKVVCDNLGKQELKEFIDSLVSGEKLESYGVFGGYIKDILQEEIDYVKLQDVELTASSVEKSVKETTISK